MKMKGKKRVISWYKNYQDSTSKELIVLGITDEPLCSQHLVCYYTSESYNNKLHFLI